MARGRGQQGWLDGRGRQGLRRSGGPRVLAERLVPRARCRRQAGTGGAGAGRRGGMTGGAAQAGRCKRGIAANTAPGAAFFPAVGWWYNWASAVGRRHRDRVRADGLGQRARVSGTIPPGRSSCSASTSRTSTQSNLTAAQAAADWLDACRRNAVKSALPIVAPGDELLRAGGELQRHRPVHVPDDFFAACTGCEVDYVAAHWYNCDLPSLKDYLEPGGSLAGFEQFGKPIWLTEFSCDASASEAQQEAYMRAAIPYLESNPHVFRYSWFSAGPIPNAEAGQQRRLADGARAGLRRPRRRLSVAPLSLFAESGRPRRRGGRRADRRAPRWRGRADRRGPSS